MGSATSFSHGARGPHPRALALGDFAPRAGRRRSAHTHDRDDFVRAENTGREGLGLEDQRDYTADEAQRAASPSLLEKTTRRGGTFVSRGISR